MRRRNPSRNGRNPTPRRRIVRRGPKNTVMMAIQRQCVTKYLKAHDLSVNELTLTICETLWEENPKWKRAAKLRTSKRGYSSPLSLCVSYKQKAWRREQ